MWTVNCSASTIDTIEVGSKITDVNVYFEGARVIRKIQKELSPGKYILSVKGLPIHLNRELIKVNAPQGVDILAISNQVVKPTRKNINSEVNKIDHQRELLDEEIKWLQMKNNIIDEEEALILRNTELEKTSGAEHVEAMRKSADFIRERLTELARMKHDNIKAIRVAQHKIQNLHAAENKLRAHKTKKQTQLLVYVDVKSLNNGKMSVEYFSEAAGWEPLYDIRFEEINKPIQLIYNAKIYQSTGEIWNGVQLTLIEGLPKQSAILPEFERHYITRKSNQRVVHSTHPKFSGTGTLKGRLTDHESGELLPFVNIAIEQNGKVVTGASSDFDGNYQVKPIASGTYDVVFSYVGYNQVRYKNVQIRENKITFLDYALKSGVPLEEFETIHYQIPLIERDGGSSGGKISRTDHSNTPIRSANSMASHVRGVQKNQTSIRGAHNRETVYYIDGINSNSIPSIFMEEAPSISSTRTSYFIQTKHVVASTGEDKLITIKKEEIAAEFIYRAMPRVTAEAFLLAKITNWGNLNLLSGKANIYFKGAYTGESQLEPQTVKDTLEIALGSDENILLERTLDEDLAIKQKHGNKVKQEINWKIKMRNNKDHKVRLELIDQMPLSDNQHIDITPLQLSQANYDTNSGQLTWEIDMEANSTSEVKFSYELKYPQTAMIYR